MPEKLMKMIEELKELSVETPGVWFHVEFWDNGKFEVFVVSSKDLPKGSQVDFRWLENIERWEKGVTVNGIRYHSLITKEQYEEENK